MDVADEILGVEECSGKCGPLVKTFAHPVSISIVREGKVSGNPLKVNQKSLQNKINYKTA